MRAGGVRAADQVLVFGDSLSKEYAVEFATDGYPDTVQNWIEILFAERPAEFDIGSGGPFLDYRFPDGHEYNWAIPTAKIQELVDIVEGKTLLDQLARASIRTQLQDEVERFVLFVGGNDVDSVYGTAYNGGLLAGFTVNFIADAEKILDWVIDQNPALEIVLVGVPHVGITPQVKSEFPPDPVKTGNVTFELALLNAGLEALAAEKGIAFADLFRWTLDLLAPDPLCFQGVGFLNASDVDGDLDYVWLGGNLADDFHPNTNGQALIANLIVEAFNARYGAGIRLLTTEEILSDLLGKNPDVTFEQWLACYGLAGASPTEDPELDGACHWTEFGLGMDPGKYDPERLPAVRRVTGKGATEGEEFLEFSYRPRLSQASALVEVALQSSTGLADETFVDVPVNQIFEAEDEGLMACFPIEGPGLFLRVEVRPVGE